MAEMGGFIVGLILCFCEIYAISLGGGRNLIRFVLRLKSHGKGWGKLE